MHDLQKPPPTRNEKRRHLKSQWMGRMQSVLNTVPANHFFARLTVRESERVRGLPSAAVFFCGTPCDPRHEVRCVTL